MVLIGLSVGVVNVIKFFATEVLVSLLLEPAWELFVARSVHARVTRGRAVPLKTFWRWRSWPCQVSSGSLSKMAAIVLSVTTIAAALLAEYSVDSMAVQVRSEEVVEVYARGEGGLSSGDGMTEIVNVVAPMADACMFKKGESHYVNSTFVEGGGCVAGGDGNSTYVVSDVCVLTKTESETLQCVYDPDTGDFSKVRGLEAANDTNRNFYTEAQEMTDPTVYVCGGACEMKREGSDPVTHYELSGTEGFSLYVSERWRAMTLFYTTDDGVSPSPPENPVFVYRNLKQGSSRTFEPDRMEADMRVVSYFHNAFQEEVTYGSFQLDRKREGVVMMLALECFGRRSDVQRIRDYRGDETRVRTDIRLAFLAPFAVLSACSAALLMVSLMRRRHSRRFFRVPVNVHDMMRFARGREAGPEFHAFGYASDGLVMGIVEDADRGQVFSLAASNPVPLDPKFWT